MKRIYLERFDNFLNSNNWKEINLINKIYSEILPVESIHSASVENLERIPYSKAKNLHFKKDEIGSEFGPSWSTHWFKIKIKVPANWEGKEVHFFWDSNSEALIWENDQPQQGLAGGMGRGDKRMEFVLTYNCPKGGMERELMIEMACNSLFGNAPSGSSDIQPPSKDMKFRLSTCDIRVFNRDAAALYYDLLIITDMAKKLDENSERGAKALFVANQMINACFTDDPSTFKEARKIGQQFLSEHNSEGAFNVTAIGHCHIDTAWLWPYGETRRKCGRSWASQIRYMEHYKWYKFGASQAQQYKWVKEDYPGLYEKIKQKVKDGQFIPIGGTWVEMDCNIPSGESFCRQFLFGQKFFKAEFGSYCKEFWLPDTFGYSAQLPQIIKSSGINYFLTQKLSWNNINKFPYHTFYWQGLDGTKVLSHFPPADTYCSHANVNDVLMSVTNYKEKERSNDSMLVYGYGDGGGGPTIHMLEQLERMKNLSGLPKVEARTPVEFFERLEKNSNNLLTWVGELYFEFHRGTYTTQAKVKKANRQCEFLLHEVESIYSFLYVLSHKSVDYPSKHINQLWELVLLNQFHDVLPGTSIELVYKDTDVYYEKVITESTKLINDGIKQLSELLLNKKVSSNNNNNNNNKKRKTLDDKSCFLVYNSFSWPISEVVEVPLNLVGEVKPLQQVNKNALAVVHGNTLGFNLTELKLEENDFKEDKQNYCSIKQDGEHFVLENQFLIAKFNSKAFLVSLVHKQTGRDVIEKPANTFVMFDDMNLFWDAWDTEIFSLEKRKDVGAGKIEIEEKGPLRVSLKTTFKISEKSYLTQKIYLDLLSEGLTFDTFVDWHESRKFLKVEFPLKLLTSQTIYETQFGHLYRPNNKNTTWEMAKFEVIAHKYCVMQEFGFGVALLNDSKYGHASEGNLLRLSLLRSSKAPDFNADMGEHRFRYSLVPFSGSFQSAGIVQKGYQFNKHLHVAPFSGFKEEFYIQNSLFSISTDSVIIDTVKKAEDDGSIILRLYECFGGQTSFHLTFNFEVKSAHLCNILEDEEEYIHLHKEQSHTKINLKITPFKILTIKLKI